MYTIQEELYILLYLVAFGIYLFSTLDIVTIICKKFKKKAIKIIIQVIFWLLQIYISFIFSYQLMSGYVPIYFIAFVYSGYFIYEKLLNDKLGTNLGYLYENVVAQLLHSNGNELFYHTFMNKTSHHNYEIDFLLAQKNKVCPIEVKSSGYKTHKSLDAFSLKYSDRILQKYLVYTKDFCKDGDIICLPIYMVPFLNQSSFRSPFG